MSNFTGDLKNNFSNKKKFNKEQQEAIDYINGPLLVLSGAGTGKTTILTNRIAKIIQENHANFNEILAVTFTNKAAREIFDRTKKILETSDQYINYNINFFDSWIGTFHSICFKILRSHAQKLGYKSGFGIIDYLEKLKIIKEITKNSPFAKDILTQVLYKKEVLDYKNKTVGDIDINQISIAYQKIIFEKNLMDFGDLIINCCKLFEENEDILNYYRNKIKYIMVDEYQDTNSVQNLLLKLLINDDQNICCVGDDDQCIYEWRGAKVDNILEFEKNYQNAKVIKVQQNYRSQNNILKVANNIISHNYNRVGKSLFSNDLLNNNKVELCQFDNNKQESDYITNTITEKVNNEEKKFLDFAVLVRTNAQIKSFEDNFFNKKIPYEIVGDIKFFDRAEIKDIIGYIRSIIYEDDNSSFERIINIPKRMLGEGFVKKLTRLASDNGLSLQFTSRIICDLFFNEDFFKYEKHKDGLDLSISFEQDKEKIKKYNYEKFYKGITQETIYNYNIKKGNIDSIYILIKILYEVRILLKSKNITPKDLIEIILEESGYRLYLQQSKALSNSEIDREENLKNLIETINDILKHLQIKIKNSFNYEELDIYKKHKDNFTKQVDDKNDNASNKDKKNKKQENIKLTVKADFNYEEEDIYSSEDAWKKVLDHIELISSGDSKVFNSVKIMTIHTSKGLEFDTVFLPGWEEGIMPASQSNTEKSIESERRLAYVGITRAKAQLIISSTLQRIIYGSAKPMKPSRFIKEIFGDNDFKNSNIFDLSSKNSNNFSLYNVERKKENQKHYHKDEKHNDDKSSNEKENNQYIIIKNFTSRNLSGINQKLSFRSSKVESDENLINNFIFSKVVIKKGNKVFHKKYLYGYVKCISGDIVTVNFNCGEKRIAKNFLKKI